MQAGESPIKTFLRYFILCSIGLALLQDIYGSTAQPMPQHTEAVAEPVHHVPLNKRQHQK